MSNFNISSKDQLNNPGRIFEEMFKDSPSEGPKTTRSGKDRSPMNMSMFTLGDILMRVPAMISPESALEAQEAITAGALSTVWDEGEAQAIGVNHLIPKELHDQLYAMSEEYGDDGSGGGSSGDDSAGGDFAVNIPSRSDITPSTRPLGIDNRTKPVARFGARVAREVLGFDGIIGGWDGNRASSSDHYTGHALDLMVSKHGQLAQGDERRMGNLIAEFFVANRAALNVSYVIWWRRITSANRNWQWQVYQRGEGQGVTWQHQDHPHISFLKKPAPSNPTLVWPDGVPISGSGSGGDNQPH